MRTQRSASTSARAENAARLGRPRAAPGDKFPWELSGGMQQRTSLCRALIHEPKLLMLDEPFGALDAFTREELWCVIRDLHAARKITIVLVTHDLREAVFLADRIFVMSSRPGRIVAERIVDIAASARPRSHLHARLQRHRARTARAHRQGAAMNRQPAHPPCAVALPPSRCSSSGKRRAGSFKIPEFFLPPPTAVVQGLGRLLAGDLHALAVHAVLDAGRLRPGGRRSGCCSASSVGWSRAIYAGLYPLMIGFNAIPKVAVVPILVLWFGIGFVPAVLTAFLISFFPIVVNVATGLATIEPELEDVLKALGASKLDIMRKVGIPRSLPYFFGSLKVAITLAFVGAVISESVASNVRHRQPDASGAGAVPGAADLRRPARARGRRHRDVLADGDAGGALDPLGAALGLRAGLSARSGQASDC